jgi:beta-glucanase (GH16 family)
MQKRLISFFFGFLLIITASVKAQVPTQLVWSDEFNYTGLPDSTKWAYDTGKHGWGNNEWQHYLLKSPKNVRVENGYLSITALKSGSGERDYTSTRLVTRGKGEWTYGRIDVRAKIPKGVGTWPAIWMLGSRQPLQWPDDGEIDIMEHVGYDQGRIHASIHSKKYNHVIGTQKTATTLVPDCSENFHVYSLIWTPQKITVLINDKSYFEFSNEKSDRTAWPFDEPEYLLLNIAVGGNWGGKNGVDPKAFPCSMLIDYVRVYQ